MNSEKAINYLLNKRYRILSRLGQGGFGSVYKAADTLLGNRPVAVKEVSQTGLTSSEAAHAVAAFNREALLLAGLTHPNLPRIYDHFTEAGRWYLIMDFIEGETLQDYLDKLGHQSFTLEKVLDIGIQLCTVLDYLHKRQPPIIFRDLKPSNVMLTPEDHVYLIDFGIARHFKQGQSKDTKAFGSVGYAAPEQYGTAQTTPRADIYSLGVTLHQLLTGHDPSLSPFRFASLQSDDQPVLLRLEALIMQMVHMDANKRPVSMAMIKQELQQIAVQQTTLPVQIAPAPSMPPSAFIRISQSSRTPFCIYHGHSAEVNKAVWSPDGKQVISISNDGIVQIWDVASGNTIFTYTGHSDHVYAVMWSPDRLYIASAGHDKLVRMWHNVTVPQPLTTLRRSSGGKFLTYLGHSDDVYALTWSLDGMYIASGSRDKTVQVWDAISRQKIFTYRGHSHLVGVVSWLPNSTYIASGSLDQTVQVWDVATRNTITTYHGHSTKLCALSWSPDGKYIASASAHPDCTVQIWNAASGHEVLTYRDHSHSVNALAWSPDGKRIASASEDVQIFDVATGNALFTYRGHSGVVNSVAWSPDGKYVVSAGQDHSVQIWQAE